jgi:multidrug efflux system membrane fusion protein
MVSTRRKVFAAGAALAALVIALGVYFNNGTGAREKKDAARDPVAVPVVVTPAIMQSTPVRIAAIGNAEPLATVGVKARVDGQIIEINFKEGEEVRRGQALIRIDARPHQAALRQAEANALRDAAASEQARSQEKRYLELLEKNFISKEAYAQIRSNAQIAEATAKAGEAALENARLNLAYCTITSPIEGFVGRALLQVGNLVKANDVNPLLVINQVKPIYVIFAVPEQSLTTIRSQMASGPVTVEALAPASERPFAEGRLVFVDNAVDPNTGTIKLRAQFDNRDASLWPGQFVNVSIRLYEQNDAILIPGRAVQTGPEGQYVYVIRPDMTAEVRKIAVDRNAGDLAVVKGVAQGEKVVTRGALRLSPGARVQIRSEGEVS